MYLRFRSCAADKYESVVVISGQVSFITVYHYTRIFDCRVKVMDSPQIRESMEGDSVIITAPTLTDVPFNNATGTWIGS